MATTSKTFSYKISRFTTESRSLQQCIVAALQKKAKARERFQKIGLEGSTIRLINSKSNQRGMLVGDMFDYTPGHNQPIVSVDVDADALPVNQLAPPPGADGKRKEFIETILYFGVLGNHVILVQSTSLKSAQFEAYIDWLLKDCAAVIPEKESIAIEDLPPQEIRRHGYTDVKALVMKAPIQKIDHRGESAGITKEVLKSLPIESNALAILKAILGARDYAFIAKSAQFEEALQNRDLELRLQVLRTRRASDDAKEVMDKMANLFRHHEGTDLEVDFDHGGKVKGSDFKISDSFNIDASGGMPIQSDLFKKMFDWLAQLIENGKVKAAP